MPDLFSLINQQILFIGNNTITECQSKEKPTEYQPFFESVWDEARALEILQSLIKREGESIPVELTQQLTNITLKEANVLGRYSPMDTSIHYYNMLNEYKEVVKIHERFHAVHHLVPDPVDGSIWKIFTDIPSFYLELLAQLFTYKYIQHYNSHLLSTFEMLNQQQSFLYRTWKIYKDLNLNEVENLYWKIRRGFLKKHQLRYLDEIENFLGFSRIDIIVYEGIRKTINRFREKPFHYFTEADIHSSLAYNIMSGASDTLTQRVETQNDISVSLIHQEYPTNFRYKKELLLQGYLGKENETNIYEHYGDRGNYDLAVLNPLFLKRMFNNCGSEMILEALKNLINKDIKLALNRNSISDEILYAIEVKYLHEFNSRHKNMFDEVKKDNEKLRLAIHHSRGFTKVINLIFCSSNESDTINNIKELVEKQTPAGVVSIFVESFMGKKKKTIKPIISKNLPLWALPFIKKLGYK